MAGPATREHEAFVYCWTDHLSHKLYVGVHKGCVDDGYISSSKYFNTEYNMRVLDFTRQVIASGTFKDMMKFECEILKSADAAKNENFYNKSNNDGKFYCDGHNETTKKKMSNTWKSKDKWNCDNTKAIDAWKGSFHTGDAKLKMKESQKKHSANRSNKMTTSNPMKNPETIAKMLMTRKLNKELKNGKS
jgi:hypothetical protein